MGPTTPPVQLTITRKSRSPSTFTIPSESTTTCASPNTAPVLLLPRLLTGPPMAPVLPLISLPLEPPTPPTPNVSEMLTTVAVPHLPIPKLSENSRSSPRASSTSPTSRSSLSGLSSSRTSTTALVSAPHPSGTGADPSRRADQTSHASPPSRTTSPEHSLASELSPLFQVF